MPTMSPDPLAQVKAPPLFDPAKPAVVPAAAPAPAAVTAVPTAAEPASAAAAATAFPHFADGASAPATAPANALVPKPVKTQTITANPAAMYDDLAKASGLTAAEKPTAHTTAQDLLEESARDGVVNPNQYAYELATTRRESHMGNWMNEFGGNTYFENNYFKNKKKAAQLGNVNPGDGAKFHGRGLVQITGRTNYTDWTHRMAQEGYQHDGQPVDMVNHPELAADPAIAAHIAVKGMRDGTFTNHKLSDYINDDNLAHPDYVGARRIINGQNEATSIAAQATTFQHVIEQHRDDYTSAMLKVQMQDLPTAQSGQLSGNPTALVPDMLSNQPLTSGAEQFVPADQLLRNPVGRFSGQNPTANITTLKTKPTDPPAT